MSNSLDNLEANGVRRPRLVLTTLVAFVCAVTADGLLLLAPAGHVLTWNEAHVLGLMAVAAVAAVALAPGAWMWGIPVAALGVFLVAVAPVIGIPGDAVLGDAQAGIAVAVVIGVQLAFIKIGLVVGASLAPWDQRR